MEYSDAKVYFDGSHYIAIPKVEQPWKKRKKQTIKTNQVLNDNFFVITHNFFSLFLLLTKTHFLKFSFLQMKPNKIC